MIIILTIGGRLPGLNEYTLASRTNKYKGAEMKRIAERKVSSYIDGQLGDIPQVERASLRFVWIEENHKRDLDNIAFAKKFILDALVNAGILADDGWKNVTGFTDEFRIDKQMPRIEVYIIPEE